ncbi:MAG: hypothetical protein Tsb002_30860 [Wenzhouxiangellaceae bacterium]
MALDMDSLILADVEFQSVVLILTEAVMAVDTAFKRNPYRVGTTPVPIGIFFGPERPALLFNTFGMGPSCFVLRNKATKMRFLPFGILLVVIITPRDACGTGHHRAD